MHSPRARVLLRSVRRGVPRPTAGHQGDRHHACPGNQAPWGGRGVHHRTQGPRGRPPAGGPSPSPRPGPDHLGAGRLPPGTGHALPVPVDQAALALRRCGALDLGHPHHPDTSVGGPRHAEKPPSRPQRPLTCGYLAVHRVLRRMGLSAPLKYPLPTTDQEVHQIRTCIRQIRAAAAKDGNFLLPTSRPT